MIQSGTICILVCKRQSPKVQNHVKKKAFVYIWVTGQLCQLHLSQCHNLICPTNILEWKSDCLMKIRPVQSIGLFIFTEFLCFFLSPFQYTNTENFKHSRTWTVGPRVTNQWWSHDYLQFGPSFFFSVNMSGSTGHRQYLLGNVNIHRIFTLIFAICRILGTMTYRGTIFSLINAHPLINAPP